MTALLQYDAACAALAAAVAIDEVLAIANKAEAMRLYARQAGDVQAEQYLAAIRLRAVRRFGQLELELKAAGQMHQGGRPPKTGTGEEPVFKIKLADLGVDKKFSSQAQALAGMGAQTFEAVVERKILEIVQRVPKVVTEVVKQQRDQDRRQAHQDRTLEGGTVTDLQALAASGFRARAILADPPWHFVTRSDKGEGRSASGHYTTDRQWDDAIALPVRDLIADDCVLFMWVVDWCPRLALDMIEAWGFEHKTTAFTWAKLTEGHDGTPRAGVISDRDWHFGMGYWTRANPEDCWLATRGHPPRLHADVRQLIVAPVSDHSRKPDEAHERIERLVVGPYLELYARRERPGWITWGNELPFALPERQTA